MQYLMAGMVLMIGVHLIPSFVVLRRNLVSGLGDKVYQLLFSVVALTGLGLIIYGKAQAEFIAIWQPPPWGRYIPFALMPVAILLLAAANMPSNVKRITPNPMLWGVLLWAVAHLFANGDQASLWLFGGFGLFALVDLVSVRRRSDNSKPDKLPGRRDVVLVLASLAVYVVLIYFHATLFGVAIR